MQILLPSLGSSRVTAITRPLAAVKSNIIFEPQARGLKIIVTRLEPSDCGNANGENFIKAKSLFKK